MLGEIFAWREDIWAEELRYFGFYLGKFVYLMDAYEDFETDKRKNAYKFPGTAERGYAESGYLCEAVADQYDVRVCQVL